MMLDQELSDGGEIIGNHAPADPTFHADFTMRQAAVQVAGAMLASYVLGGTGIISQTQGGATSYFLQDGQGSTRALTNASGNITDSYSFTAFGKLFQSSATGTNYLYTGQQFDSLTGLYSLRARYYNPYLRLSWSLV
jgi:hypothetical protein